LLLLRATALAAALPILLEALPSRAAARGTLESEAQALELRWAPTYAQAVSRAHPERDRPLPIDFDGDWDATNNWRHLTPAMRSRTPAVYAAAILTKTHAYLTYTLFYPRDWISPICVQLVCHDNDLENVLFVAERPSPSHPDGKLVLVETKAHNSYPSLAAKDLAFDSGGHPLLRVESQGHGIYPVKAGERLDGAARMLFVATGDNDRGAERYTLLQLHDTLWAHRLSGAGGGKLWSAGESGFLGYRGARWGRRGGVLGDWMAQSQYRGGVRPPWGLKAAPGARGDWFFDPALVETTRHPQALNADGPASQDYVFNPYLDDLTASCSGAACPAPPTAPVGSMWLFGTLGAAFVGVGLVSSRLRRRGSRTPQ
jgi:hypothetical protein